MLNRKWEIRKNKLCPQFFEGYMERQQQQYILGISITHINNRNNMYL